MYIIYYNDKAFTICLLMFNQCARGYIQVLL